MYLLNIIFIMIKKKHIKYCAIFIIQTSYNTTVKPKIIKKEVLLQTIVTTLK